MEAGTEEMYDSLYDFLYHTIIPQRLAGGVQYT